MKRKTNRRIPLIFTIFVILTMMSTMAFAEQIPEGVTCDACDGTGKGTDTVQCSNCDGVGEFECSECGGSGTVAEWNCPTCGGRMCDDEGNACSECNGTGVVTYCTDCNRTGYIPCEICGGYTEVLADCEKCQGTGVISEEPEPEIVLTPYNVSASAITYGQSLSASTISGTMMFGEEAIEGSWSWEDPTAKPEVSDSDTTEYTIIFKPSYEIENVEEIEASVKITVNKAKVDLPTANKNLIYNGSEQSGVALPADAAFTISGNTAKNAGDYTATAVLNDKDNYEWNLETATSADQEIAWSIAKKEIKVTADDKTSYVGSDLEALTYTNDALCAGDSLTGALATTANKDKANTYEITQGSLSAGDNYTIVFTNGTYTTARQKQTLVFEGVTDGKVVKGKNQGTFTLTVSGAKTDVTYKSSDESIASVDSKTGAVTCKWTGTVVISATALENEMYEGATASYTLVKKFIDGASDAYVDSSSKNSLGVFLNESEEDLNYKIFTADELMLINSGEGASIQLATKDLGMNAPSEAKAAIEQTLPVGSKVLSYMEISIVKQVGNADPQSVHLFNSKITDSKVSVPSGAIWAGDISLKGDKNNSNLEGKATVKMSLDIPGDYIGQAVEIHHFVNSKDTTIGKVTVQKNDSTGKGIVTFETDSLSIFAIVVLDESVNNVPVENPTVVPESNNAVNENAADRPANNNAVQENQTTAKNQFTPPNTGDSNNTWIWWLLMMASGIVVVALLRKATK